MSITGNIAKVEERIQKACDLSGRKRDEIILMGVSKFMPLNAVEEAFRAGIEYFGESRVQEGMEKFDSFKKEHPQVSLHMIGSLQRNKAKQASLFFDCIQSADRWQLIEELAKHVPARNKPLEILLELHTGEETKNGFSSLDELYKAAQLTLEKTGLKPAGLMTMAPFTDDTEEIRASFRQLVKAQSELRRRFPVKENWNCLSMGMSNDFETAIEEGSTMLRIGSLIFKD
ncbi:MAG: YggS family pyridoxal phosphate-dependent enzyme [Treponema sp.]|nr:YggS family pyridoxal phosphate-dependent enzyme [Treponema sp.]MCL2271427.1 YggS family pyridoxal phosphate-dependent enzyme [Treponema sp.]